MESDKVFEEWRDVVGYEGIYQVSSLGNVKSVPRVDSKGRPVKGCMKKVQIDAIGYPYVFLYKAGKQKKGYIHRLIAEAFIPNPEGYECVDHINGVRADSYLGNLRWCSRRQNFQFAVEMGTIRLEDKSAIMRSGVLQKASREVCRRPVMRSDGKVYESITDAAKDIGRAKSNVFAVIKGLRKTSGGYSFTYV